MTDGRELAVCSKHDGWVASCWFSSDSDMLVSVSNNIKVHTPFFTWRCGGLMVSDCLRIKQSGFEPWLKTMLCCVLGQDT